MANPTMEGLNEEIESYERQLEEAEKNGDEERAKYLRERIRRAKIEIDNLKNFNGTFS